jgi:hypothetical protein
MLLAAGGRAVDTGDNATPASPVAGAGVPVSVEVTGLSDIELIAAAKARMNNDQLVADHYDSLVSSAASQIESAKADVAAQTSKLQTAEELEQAAGKAAQGFAKTATVASGQARAISAELSKKGRGRPTRAKARKLRALFAVYAVKAVAAEKLGAAKVVAADEQAVAADLATIEIAEATARWQVAQMQQVEAQARAAAARTAATTEESLVKQFEAADEARAAAVSAAQRENDAAGRSQKAASAARARLASARKALAKANALKATLG